MAPQSTGPISAVPGAAATASAQQQQQQPDASDAASVQNEQIRQDLELKLQEMIECLLELSITVYDFQSESNSLVHQKIQELITQLSDIEGFKDKLDMMVPWEVLGYIEDGKNPDLFSKSFVEAVAGENQFTNGKITALKAGSFESALTQNLGSFFPDEMMDYNQLVASASTSDNTTAPRLEHPNDVSTTVKQEVEDGSFLTVNNTVSTTSSAGSSSVSPAS
ncbi:Mediator of RNA polymerase II transcription subunit 10 [Entomortierella chlamydospora]|uniref:Mediator of RNA polymerase II transcription subunit 10 n=1 Tax=Entomortierella chlamydospora TaxID=101097 RepID=A0A9P6SY13_9FUNG|nr:Mediator of RNA polymerase II transcription subunit 10 [Entomortierella chlamydospora]